MDGTDRLARLGDTDRVVKLSTQEHSTHGIVAHRVATELKRLAHAPVFRRAAADGWQVGRRLGQTVEERGRVEVVRIGKDNEQVMGAKVRAYTGRHLLSRLVSTAAQLWHEEARHRQRVRTYCQHRHPGSVLDLPVAGQYSARAAPDDMGGARYVFDCA